MDLTIPQILQAAAHELMRQYGRHHADAIWEAIHTAMTVHDARTAALAAVFTEEQFDSHEATHWCNPACAPGCDIGRIRTWTAEEVVSRREPLSEDEVAAIAETIALAAMEARMHGGAR